MRRRRVTNGHQEKASDGTAVVIVRVEDGILGEIATAFWEPLHKVFGARGVSAPGSVILIRSLSQPGRRSIGNYAEELVHVIGSLSSRVGTVVEIVPLVFVPLEGDRRTQIDQGFV